VKADVLKLWQLTNIDQFRGSELVLSQFQSSQIGANWEVLKAGQSTVIERQDLNSLEFLNSLFELRSELLELNVVQIEFFLLS
jgi:hypothetical protein